MILSPKYKRFKRINFTGDTFTLPMVRSSIIRTIQRYHSHKNTVNLKRLEKEAQNKEIQPPKTDRLLSVCDRALFAISYADMVIFTGHILRPDVSRPDVSRPSVSTSHIQVFKKPKTYADTVIISGHPARPDVSRPSVSTSHGLIPNHPYNNIHIYLITSHIQINTKPKTYLNNEMIPILGYYSYATKYHNGSSMFVPGYQCSNVYIDNEKRALMNKDIQ